MSKKDSLIEYINLNGRAGLTWQQLAQKFGIHSGEAARHYWRRHQRETRIPPMHTEPITVYTGKVTVAPTSVVDFEQDLKNRSAIVNYKGVTDIKTKEQLAQECNIDLAEWDVVKMRNVYLNGAWQVRVELEPKNVANGFGEQFIDFLKTYKHTAPVVKRNVPNILDNKSCLVFNKQDAHLDKFDVRGNNNIQDRFDMIEQKTQKILKKATATSNLDTIIYVLGSDQFNSEWNELTTKGTPQKNLLPFHEGFQAICDHEVRVIDYLLQNCNNLHVMYVSGNHDEYIGWHMMTWLQAYYRNQSNLTIDTSPAYRKYVKFSNTAMMFNHGDVVKPLKLAQLFPIEYSKDWSSCDHYYIFTGDKHREINADFNGIKFYGIPALSTSKSKWDEKNGYVGTKAEMTAFLIEEDNGVSDIYKEFM